MTFTYHTSPENSPGERDYIRFHLQDVTKGKGPLPEDRNFEDHELDMMLEVEGSWQRAVAAGFEALAAAWMVNPSWQADGMAVSQSHIGKNAMDNAIVWRKRYGGAFGSNVFARSMIKVDGYSQDITSAEVT